MRCAGSGLAGDAEMPTRAKLLDWRPLEKNTLKGFASVQFTSGVIFREIAVHVSGSRAWAAPPSRPWIKDNALVFDETTGKAKWQMLVDFANHGVRASWSRQVISALAAAHPEVLAGTTDDQGS